MSNSVNIFHFKRNPESEGRLFSFSTVDARVMKALTHAYMLRGDKACHSELIQGTWKDPRVSDQELLSL